MLGSPQLSGLLQGRFISVRFSSKAYLLSRKIKFMPYSTLIPLLALPWWHWPLELLNNWWYFAKHNFTNISISLFWLSEDFRLLIFNSAMILGWFCGSDISDISSVYYFRSSSSQSLTSCCKSKLVIIKKNTLQLEICSQPSSLPEYQNES